MKRKTTQVQQENDYSNPSELSIDNLAFKTRIETLQQENQNLVATNVGLSQTVDRLIHQLEQKTNEILHLQELLNGIVPEVGQATPFSLTDEEMIAEFQLKALKATAMTRDLTLDETKRFDLLVKNKRLAKGDATSIEGKRLSSPKSSANVEELIQIAKSPVKKVE